MSKNPGTPPTPPRPPRVVDWPTQLRKIAYWPVLSDLVAQAFMQNPDSGRCPKGGGAE